MFFHLTGIGPALRQVGFFKKQASEQLRIAIARFGAESERVLAALDGVLAKSTYTAGNSFTTADIAHFGWPWRREFAGIDFEKTPNIARWHAQWAQRPAVVKAIEGVSALAPAA